MQPATCEAKYTTAKARPEDRDLRRHLEGERTIAVPLIGADGLAVAGGLDVDEGGEGALLAALGAAQQAGLTAWAITSTNDEHDGGWVWFLYTSAVAPERIRAQLTALAVVAGVRADIFPTRQAARLPFGVHTWTGRRGILLLQDGRRFDLDSAELEAGIAAVLALSRNPAPPNIEAPPVPKPPPRRQPAVHAGTDAIGRFCATTDLVDLLASYPGYSLVARSGQGGTLRCGCPGHKHGDRRPSLEVKHGRDGRQVAVGYAPGCIWHNQRGRNDAFNVYCELERLTPREAVKRLASPLPARPRSFPPHPAENTPEPTGPDLATSQARNREAERKRVARQEAARHVRAAVEQRLTTDQALSKRGRAVLTHLLAFAGSRDWCRPSVARLVELTGYSERTVQYALRDLEAAGYLCSTLVEHGTSLRRFLAPLEASVGVRQLVEPLPEPLAPIETAAQGEQQAATDDVPIAPVSASECTEAAPESKQDSESCSGQRACERGGAAANQPTEASQPSLPLDAAAIDIGQATRAGRQPARTQSPRFGEPARVSTRKASGLPRKSWAAADVPSLEAELQRRQAMLRHLKRGPARRSVEHAILELERLITSRRDISLVQMLYANAPEPQPLGEPQAVRIGEAIAFAGGAVFAPPGSVGEAALRALIEAPQRAGSGHAGQAPAAVSPPRSQAPHRGDAPGSATTTGLLPDGWELERCDHRGNATSYGAYWRALGPDGVLTEPTMYLDTAQREAWRSAKASVAA